MAEMVGIVELGSAAANKAATLDAAAEIAALRATAADRHDPVRFHFIESLARRAQAQADSVRQVLDERLANALAAYRNAYEQAQSEAGNITGARHVVAKQEKAPSLSAIAELTRYIAQHSPENLDGSLEADFGSRSELKTIRNFRSTWSKLSVDKQVAQAIEHPPENAGPLNSHLLVLRSLALMRELSPDYLNRFMAYADTLLTLDQADKNNKATVKKPLATKTTKATKK